MNHTVFHLFFYALRVVTVQSFARRLPREGHYVEDLMPNDPNRELMVPLAGVNRTSRNAETTRNVLSGLRRVRLYFLRDAAALPRTERFHPSRA